MKAYTNIGNKVYFVDESGSQVLITEKLTEHDALVNAKSISTKEIPYYPCYLITHRVGRDPIEDEILNEKAYYIGYKYAQTYFIKNSPVGDLTVVPTVVLDQLRWTPFQLSEFKRGWRTFVTPGQSQEISHQTFKSDFSFSDIFIDSSIEKEGNRLITLNATSLQSIINKGILVNLEIKRWRASTSLSEEDLGIVINKEDIDSVQKEYLSLGKRNLLPKDKIDALNNLESLARNNLIRNSYSTPWGRFVTEAKWKSWKEKNAEIKEQYLNLGKEIAQNSDDLFKQVLEDYMKIAPAIYGRTIGRGSTYPSEEWIDKYKNKIISKFPDKQTILDSFSFTNVLMRIPSINKEDFEFEENPSVKEMIDEFLSVDNFPDLYLSILKQVVEEMKATFDRTIDSINSGKLTKAGNIHPATKAAIVDICVDFITHVQEQDTRIPCLELKTYCNGLIEYSKNEYFSKDKSVTVLKLQEGLNFISKYLKAEN